MGDGGGRHHARGVARVEGVDLRRGRKSYHSVYIDYVIFNTSAMQFFIHRRASLGQVRALRPAGPAGLRWGAR
jgi:hypothetical protein